MALCHVLSVLKCDEQDSEKAGNSATQKPQQFTESPKTPWTQWPTQRVRHTPSGHKTGPAWGAVGKGTEGASVSLGRAWDEGAFRG